LHSVRQTPGHLSLYAYILSTDDRDLRRWALSALLPIPSLGDAFQFRRLEVLSSKDHYALLIVTSCYGSIPESSWDSAREEPQFVAQDSQFERPWLEGFRPLPSQIANPSGAADSADAYTAAILQVLGQREPLAVFQATPAALRPILADLSLDELSRPERPGKWSMRAVIQHLADTELILGYRFRMVLAHDRPTMQACDQDLWADRLDYATSDLEAALADFTTLRHANLRLLERTSAAQRQRVGLHTERGEESVAHMMRMYAGHDLVHLRQLERIRSGLTAISQKG
jgi:uncharacterized damage-inducible protein DinB